MSKINVSTITNRTGTSGPVLSGVTTATNGFHVTGGSVGIGTDNPLTQLQVNASNESTISLVNAGTKKAALQSQNSFGNILYSYDSEPLIFSVAPGASFSEKIRITSDGDIGVGNNNPTYKVSVKDTKADGTGVQMHLWNNSVDNTAGNVWSGIRFTGSTGDYETAEIKGWRVHPGTNLNSLSINTGGVERMVLSSGGVGIGTNVLSQTAGGRTVLNINGTSNSLLNFSHGGTLTGFIYGANDEFRFESHDTKPLVFRTAGGTALTIDTNAKLILPTGSPGIQFGTPDNPAASGGNDISSQTLDDYEEGTWSPTLTSGTASLSDCIYTKIGNIVTLSGYLYNFSDRGSSNNIGIQSLPYNNAVSQACGNTFGRYLGVDGAGGLCNYVSSNTIYLYEVNNSDYLALEHVDLTNVASAIYFAATYRTNS